MRMHLRDYLFLIVFLIGSVSFLLGSCSSKEPAECSGLFGVQHDASGLPPESCSPTCECDGETWTAPVLDQALMDALKARVLLNPPEDLSADPYDVSESPAHQTGVCGVLNQGEGSKEYTLKSYESADLAQEAGAVVTHRGACGRCSTLHDLAIYMNYTDLTEPVRACGMKSFMEGADASLECLKDMGFTPPCAKIWMYNTIHTRKECLAPCLALLEAPYHNEDGTLNECLACDEEKSGPVFKAVAGRTRRNSGLASAICRPCAEVYRLDHRYE
ncbi:MAG: hypothetical protein VX699_08455 [Myxococcota bacterium]|nr:hypothetical protein [Myxococcota bacterium]